MKYNFIFSVLLLLGCSHSPVTDDSIPKPATVAPTAAASGLVHVDDHYFIISDDSDLLYQCTYGLKTCETFTPPFHKEMPKDPKDRKDLKLDFESLVMLPHPNPDELHLLAIPSGSKKYRFKGGLYILNKVQNKYTLNFERSKIVDFSKIYHLLDEKIKKLNIEGVAILEDEKPVMRLFHRGNSKKGVPAMIDLNFSDVIEAINNNVAIANNSLLSIKDVRLKTGGFTDAYVFKFKNNFLIAYLSAEEVTDDPVNDGKILGSKMGVMNREGKILAEKSWSRPVKAEGLVTLMDKKNKMKVIAVTDADNPAVPAEWLEAMLDLSSIY